MQANYDSSKRRRFFSYAELKKGDKYDSIKRGNLFSYAGKKTR